MEQDFFEQLFGILRMKESIEVPICQHTFTLIYFFNSEYN